MNRVRRALAVTFVTVALLGAGSPASAVVSTSTERAGKFCFEVDVWGLIPPFTVCIPLI